MCSLTEDSNMVEATAGVRAGALVDTTPDRVPVLSPDHVPQGKHISQVF